MGGAPATRRILGVDPGIGRTGVALIVGAAGSLRLHDARCIETQPGTPEGVRLAALRQQLRRAVDELTPDVAAVESLFFSANRSTAMAVAQARGVVLCTLAEAGVDIVEYAPNQVKEAVVGFGGARKPQVGRMVRHLLGVERIPGPDDTTDACAIAICHHHRGHTGPAAAALATRPSSRMGPRLEAAVQAARQRLTPETL